MRQRTSPIWLQGEDLQLKEGDGSTIYYYCYIYKRLKKTQELSIVLSGRSTVLTYLVKDYNIDKATGLLKKHGEMVPT